MENPPPGTHDICPVCYWQDDGVQFDDIDIRGGANVVSLRQAWVNFQKLGACSAEFQTFVRPATANEIPHD